MALPISCVLFPEGQKSWSLQGYLLHSFIEQLPPGMLKLFCQEWTTSNGYINWSSHILFSGEDLLSFPGLALLAFGSPIKSPNQALADSRYGLASVFEWELAFQWRYGSVGMCLGAPFMPLESQAFVDNNSVTISLRWKRVVHSQWERGPFWAFLGLLCGHCSTYFIKAEFHRGQLNC